MQTILVNQKFLDFVQKVHDETNGKISYDKSFPINDNQSATLFHFDYYRPDGSWAFERHMFVICFFDDNDFKIYDEVDDKNVTPDYFTNY